MVESDWVRVCYVRLVRTGCQPFSRILYQVCGMLPSFFSSVDTHVSVEVGFVFGVGFFFAW